jgi:hypothetical protein
MVENRAKRDWPKLATRAAVILSIGGVSAALIGSIGSGTGAWHFRTGFAVLQYALFAAVAGIVLAIVALVWARVRRRGGLLVPNLVALVVALGFVLFVGNLIRTAKSVPPIHDVATDLADVPQFEVLKVRADNMEGMPDMGRAELKRLDPEQRWKAMHREAYGDLRTVRLAVPPAEAIRRAEALARKDGWAIAKSDPAAGRLEATATSLFFRFKDDVVVRARPAPGGGSLVDMRSVSRVGMSDVGMNAKRVRAFLKELAAP